MLSAPISQKMALAATALKQTYLAGGINVMVTKELYDVKEMRGKSVIFKCYSSEKPISEERSVMAVVVAFDKDVVRLI